MHLILCLIKQFMTIWFEKDGPWTLKNKRDDINAFLLELKVPDFLTRIPRSTECYTSWKANELRSFLFFPHVKYRIFKEKRYVLTPRSFRTINPSRRNLSLSTPYPYSAAVKGWNQLLGH
ncbi:Proline--tRNA ligase, partial [Frankliniella fusca]